KKRRNGTKQRWHITGQTQFDTAHSVFYDFMYLRYNIKKSGAVLRVALSLCVIMKIRNQHAL
ncbi:MAG: hypothetical protein ABJD55_13900, partial [Flavobacteriaceae bacterium]